MKKMSEAECLWKKYKLHNFNTSLWRRGYMKTNVWGTIMLNEHIYMVFTFDHIWPTESNS